MIDYAQLGLMFKLYSCEVLFNRGLCYIYLQQREAGMQDLSFAVKEKVVEDHNVIDDAIAEEAEVCFLTLFVPDCQDANQENRVILSFRYRWGWCIDPMLLKSRI